MQGKKVKSATYYIHGHIGLDTAFLFTDTHIHKQKPINCE